MPAPASLPASCPSPSPPPGPQAPRAPGPGGCWRPPEGPPFARARHRVGRVWGSPWARPLLLCCLCPGCQVLWVWMPRVGPCQPWRPGRQGRPVQGWGSGSRERGCPGWARLPTAGTPAAAPGSSGTAPVLSRPSRAHLGPCCLGPSALPPGVARPGPVVGRRRAHRPLGQPQGGNFPAAPRAVDTGTAILSAPTFATSCSFSPFPPLLI